MLSAVQHMEQVAKRKQCESQNGAEEIQVVSGTVAFSPTHRGNEVKSLSNVCEHHNEQGYCATDL